MPSGVSLRGRSLRIRAKTVCIIMQSKTVILLLVDRGQQSKLAALRHETRLTYGELAHH